MKFSINRGETFGLPEDIVLQRGSHLVIPLRHLNDHTTKLISFINSVRAKRSKFFFLFLPTDAHLTAHDITGMELLARVVANDSFMKNPRLSRQIAVFREKAKGVERVRVDGSKLVITHRRLVLNSAVVPKPIDGYPNAHDVLANLQRWESEPPKKPVKTRLVK